VDLTGVRLDGAEFENVEVFGLSDCSLKKAKFESVRFRDEMQAVVISRRPTSRLRISIDRALTANSATPEWRVHLSQPK
jgi:hypothetical protein